MKFKLSLITILFLLFNFSFGFSQGILKDDPNLDQIPFELIKNYNPNKAPLGVITVDGWDNFDLGVDFAEGHNSVHPKYPTQFFNAWNTNKTHYTYDGLNWLNGAPAFGSTMRGDPVTAYDSLGNLYYQNMYGASSIVGALVIKSTNNGQTWTSPGVISVAGNDKNWIACDQTAGPYANYVYATMTNSSAGGGSFYRSTDFGVSFQNIRTFSTQSLPGMMVAVGPNKLNGQDISGGAVYVVTNSGSSTASTYTFYVSNDGGSTFTLKSSQIFANYVGSYVGGRNSVQNMRTRPYPFIAADNSFGPYRGRLYLVYASNNPAGDLLKPDIFCRYSDDQGATWSSAVIINDDPNSVNNHQWMPAIWCDKQTGRLYVQWMDTRNVPTSDSCEIYASYSDNGGISFAPNQLISNRKFKIDCATCGGGGTPRYQGDYNSIVSNGMVSMPIWGDFRYGNFNSFTAYFPDFAMTLDNASITINSNNDSTFTMVNIPGVKLYNSYVKFSSTVSPQPSSGTLLAKFNYDSLMVVPGSVKLTLKSINNVSPGNYVVTITAQGPNGTPVHKREINVTVTEGPLCDDINVIEGWNIVSLPRISSSMLASDLFPTKTSNVYGFNTNYYVEDTLKPGKGYFVKFNSAAPLSVCGSVSSNSSIPVQAGWNLIGPLNNDVPVSLINTVPSGILSSLFYGYNNGYIEANTLISGNGYWIKCSQNGTIILPSLEKISHNNYKQNTKSDKPEKYIQIIDNSNHKINLYLTLNSAEIQNFELPPVPPEGIFDARFMNSSSYSFEKDLTAKFLINSAEFPVIIKFNGFSGIIKDQINGNILNKHFTDGDELIIYDKFLKTFEVNINNKEMSYKLYQNYPNPFNPETIFKYDLPEKTYIKLNVYDALGNKIITLFEGTKEKGTHSQVFNGKNLSSGTYFLELNTGDSNFYKKMLLLK